MSDELADRLRHHVNSLAAVPRPPGSASHSQAAELIQSELRAADFAVEEAIAAEGQQDGLEEFAWKSFVLGQIT